MKKYLATLLVIIMTVSLMAPLNIYAAVQPLAPKVTADDVNNKVIGMKTTYEYSLDGAAGVMYQATSFALVDLSGNHELRVRVAATRTTVAGKITTLRFTENPAPLPVVQPNAPIVTGDDLKNTVTGMKTTYEYSINGANGVMYNATTFALVDLSGNVEFRVRVAETATTPAGLITTLIFTTNPVIVEPAPTPSPTPVSQPAAPNVTGDDLNNTVTGMKTTYEYSINGANGVMYNATTFALVDLSGDVEFRVRVAETATTPAGLITTLKFTTNPVLQAPVLQAPLAPVASIFADSFEETLSSRWTKEFPNSTYSGKVSNNYASAGSSSFRIELRKSDPNVHGSKRSEIALLDLEGPAEQHTYNFGILLPNGGDEDYALDPKGSEIIAQWHNVPDAGEEWTTPPLALRTFNGRYVLERCWDDAAITTSAQMTAKGFRAKHDLGSYTADKGKFVNWSFKVKWGWLASQNPKIEVFKDGIKIITIDGPNTTNDKKGNVMKLGIYKWDWAQTNDTSILSTRVIYYDNVSIQ
jgi:hypothetical protein